MTHHLTTTLGRIAKISSGGTPDRTKASYWSGSIPWVKTAQIQNGVIRADDIDEWITQEGFEKSSARMIPKGTILMAMYGQGKTRGQVAILGLDATINQACAAIQLNAEANRDYVFQQLRYRYNSIRALSNTGSQENLNADLIREIAFPLPSLHEQERAAEVLNTWDAAIETTERLIAAKERHFAAISHLLLTARKRLKGFTSHWAHRRAEDIFENSSRKGHRNERLLSVTQERGVIPRDMLEARVTMPSGETGTFKLVEPGNFVISLRSFQGGLEYSAYRGLVSPAYTVLQALVEIDDRFFRHYFKSADFIKRLSVAVIGIRDGKQVSFQDFCSIKLPFPEIKEQQAMGALLDKFENEIELLRSYAEALKIQKRGLMQKLLTGQWRLNEHKEVSHG